MYYVWETRVRAGGDVIIPERVSDELVDALLGAHRIARTG